MTSSTTGSSENGSSASQRIVDAAPARLVAGEARAIEEQHLHPARSQLARRRAAGRAGADDDRLGFHASMLRRGAAAVRRAVAQSIAMAVATRKIACTTVAPAKTR